MRSILKKWSVSGIFILILGCITLYFFPHLKQLTSLLVGTSSQQSQGLPSVNYKVIKIEKVRPWSEFSGKCRAIDYVEIRPRVTGVIQKILFKEGTHVQKDDPLFIIDPRPFEAAVDKAKANLDSMISQEKLADIELKRTEKLVKTKAVSQKEFDERTSTKETRAADIEAAKASLKTAELDLEFAHIKSPIDGKISRAEITEGNLVEAGANAPILTTVVSTSAIYVDFDMDEQSYIDAASSLDTQDTNAHGIPVEVNVDGGKNKTTYKGHIEYFDNRINPTTGTLKVRARVENLNDILVSGIFVNVKVGTREAVDAVLIPDEAISTDQNKKFVYVIDENNKAVYREIKLGRSFEKNYIVTSGLHEGDKVIVKGVQRVRPGVPVEASEVKTDDEKNKAEEDFQKSHEKNLDEKKHQKTPEDASMHQEKKQHDLPSDTNESGNSSRDILTQTTSSTKTSFNNESERLSFSTSLKKDTP